MATPTTTQAPNTPKYDKVSGLLTDYGKSLGLKEVNPGNNVITSKNLDSNGRPYTLPDSKPNTTATGLSEYIGSTTATNKTQAQKDYDARIVQRDKDKSTLDTTLQSLLNTNTEIAGAASTIDRTAEDKAKKEADMYTSQIEAEQLSNRRKLEDLAKNNPTGMLSSGVAIQSDNINRASVSHQADLAILQNSALRNYETANAIADRQLALKLEPLKAKADNLKTFIDYNKQLFNTEDARLYDEAQKKADAELKKQTDIESTIKEIKLTAVQNGAGASTLAALGAIDTTKPGAFDQAIKAAGSYLATSQNDVVKLDNGSTVLINKRTGAVIKNFGGSSTTPTIVQRTVSGKPVDGYTLIAGDDPYFIAQKYGTNMDGLKALNPKVTDWNNLPVGATINVPSKNAPVTAALQTILGSGKFTKDQAAAVANAINNGQDPFTVIKNNAKNIMGQTEATKLTSYESARDTLSDLGKELAQFYAAGGKTSLISGNFEKVYNNLGTVNDPKLVALASQIQGNIQVYRNAISGTAYSTQEGKDIQSIFPGINKSEALNNAILNGRNKLFDSTIDSIYRSALGKTYDDLKANSSTPVDPLQNVLSFGEAHPELKQTLTQMQLDGQSIEAISNWINQKQ